jgi:hypothetical protein
MAEWPAAFIEVPQEGLSNLKRPRRQPAIGDQSVVIGYSWERLAGQAQGYTIYARIGSTVVMLLVASLAGPPLAEVVPIAEAMAACLAADEPCAEMERPDSLMPPE